MSETYRNTPWGDVTIEDSWPEWRQKMWRDVLGAPPIPFWVPTFETGNVIHWIDNSGQQQTIEVDTRRFATEATAQELLRRFNANHVARVPWEGAGGPTFTTAWERWLVFTDGIAVNAGLMAVPFAFISPTNSKAATAQAQKVIDDARSIQQKLPVK